MIHPNFIIGLISYLALLTGVLMFAIGVEAGKAVVLVAFILGGLHWIGSIINVSNDSLIKENEGLWYFWFASVFLVPPIGGMIYYMVNNKRVSF